MNRELKLFPRLILISFVCCFVLGISGGIPSDLFISTNLWALANLCYIVGCALLSLKASGENRHISAAGFILLSIGMITLFTLQTTVSNEVSAAYFTDALIIVPGYALIYFYDGFPKWVRIAGILSSMPRLAMVLMVYWKHSFEIQRNQLLDALGYFFPAVVGLIWSYYSYKEMKKAQ